MDPLRKISLEARLISLCDVAKYLGRKTYHSEECKVIGDAPKMLFLCGRDVANAKHGVLNGVLEVQ